MVIEYGAVLIVPLDWPAFGFFLLLIGSFASIDYVMTEFSLPFRGRNRLLPSFCDDVPPGCERTRIAYIPTAAPSNSSNLPLFC